MTGKVLEQTERPLPASDITFPRKSSVKKHIVLSILFLCLSGAFNILLFLRSATLNDQQLMVIFIIAQVCMLMCVAMAITAAVKKVRHRARKKKRKQKTVQQAKTTKSKGGRTKPTHKRLSEKEVKQIRKNIKKGNAHPRTAQETIPYERMWPNGVCLVDGNFYTYMVRFSDMNYQLASDEDKSKMFMNLCDFINYFGAEIPFQFYYLNQKANLEDQKAAIQVPENDGSFKDLREEYQNLIYMRMHTGGNRIERNKYIVFGVRADNYKEAAQRLVKIKNDVLSNFKRMDCEAWPVNGKERLKLMHGMLNGNDKNFMFDWSDIKQSGLSTKDHIACSGFDFRPAFFMRIGERSATTQYLQIAGKQLTDDVLSSILEQEKELVVSIHVKGIVQDKAIQTIKRTLSTQNSNKLSVVRNLVKQGVYADDDFLPHDLKENIESLTELHDQLVQQNEHYYLATIIVSNIADTRKGLMVDKTETETIMNMRNCPLQPMPFQQEQGFVTNLPLGLNKVNINRSVVTTTLSTFMPFISQELFQKGANSIFYGVNAQTNSLILLDRKRLANPNGLYLGVPGAGKSMATKNELYGVMMKTADHILILDPEGEYHPLVFALNGQTIKVSTSSEKYINPMDIDLDIAKEGEKPLALKANFILSFFELVMNRHNGLEPIEKTIIDRCIPLVYKDYLQDPAPEKMPILSDLFNILLEQPELEAQRLATGLELYVSGSLNLFNHHTNVDIHNRLVCFDIKELEEHLKPLAMLVIQDQVWTRVSQNRAKHIHTWYYCDEFHLLLKEKQTANYSVSIWKRFRKWYGIPTGITQNVKDLLLSDEVSNIFDNTKFVCMLAQASGDREILARELKISEQQTSFIDNAQPGEGLIKYGKTIIPFRNPIPKDTQMYRLMTTNPQDLLQYAEENKSVS